MKTIKVTIANELGIHCRPSAIIINKLNQFPGCQISLNIGDEDVPISGVLDLMSMCLEKGMEVIVKASGKEEDEACFSIATLLSTDFDFKR